MSQYIRPVRLAQGKQAHGEQGFVNILFVVLVVVIAGAVGFFVLNNQSATPTSTSPDDEQPTSPPVSPTSTFTPPPTPSSKPATKSPPNPTPTSAQPPVTVLSPNGGEIFQLGEMYEIAWKQNIVTDGVRIDLRRDIPNEGGKYTLIEPPIEYAWPSAKGSRSYRWIIKDNLVPAADYRICVSAYSHVQYDGPQQQNGYDCSDATFQITVRSQG